MKVAKFIERNERTLPLDLANLLLQETSIWSNQACYGYCMIAMRNAGFSPEQRDRVIHYLHSAFDQYAVEEAEEKWIEW